MPKNKDTGLLEIGKVRITVPSPLQYREKIPVVIVKDQAYHIYDRTEVLEQYVRLYFAGAVHYLGTLQPVSV